MAQQGQPATAVAKPQGPKKTAEPICDEEWAKALVDIVKEFEVADQPVRDRQVRKWRKQMLYWDHVQYLWWSEVAHDWRSPDQLQDLEGSDIDIDPSLYAKVINIYRAHGEVVIAAMSANVPKVLFPPQDADDPEDVITAKAYGRLGEIIYRHNYAELLLIQALYILYNQGLVCAYTENYESEEYGVVEKPLEKRFLKTMRQHYCPDCGTMLGEQELGEVPHPDDEPIDENYLEDSDVEDTQEGADDAVGQMKEGMSAPDEGSPAEPTPSPDMATPMEEEPVPEPNVQAANIPPIAQAPCPQCSAQAGAEVQVKPDTEDYDDTIVRTTGFETLNKCREVITMWGPMNVKVPAWVRRQQDTPYLILETEEHFAALMELYPEIMDKIAPHTDSNSVNRSPTAYMGDLPRDLCVVRRCWLRPWAFNQLNPGGKEDVQEKVDELKEKFPTGCYVVIINGDIAAEALEDKLDEHWTLSHHPLSDGIHAEPIGAPLIPMQEMTNELGNLTLETIEHEIPELFADGDTVDFDAYGRSEARPGMMYKAKRTPGDNLANSFHEVKGGSLSREVDLFADRLEKFSQFVVGSLPSVFGGQIDGGSNTAKEYEMSRNQALQRLSTTWKLVTSFWAQTIGKAVKSFAINMIEDEKYPVEQGSGNFVNVWVKQAQLTGDVNVGNAFCEASESLPMSWNEKRSVLIAMLQMGNEQVMAVLAHPENASLVARLIGLSELYIPGDDDRTKQLSEIALLVQEEPIEEMPPMAPEGQPGMAPPPEMGPEMGGFMPEPIMKSSIAIEPELDNHEIEAEICRAWLKSEVGQDAKKNRPAAYLNVLLHMKEHAAIVSAQAINMENQEQEAAQSGDKDVQEVGGNA